MDQNQKKHPNYFHQWEQFLATGSNPGFYETDEFTDIIEIYIKDNQPDKMQKTIDYALFTYPDYDDLLYDIFLLLNDYELWNDLLKLSIRYSKREDIWVDGHHLTALLHLGMEDEAFSLFRNLKTKYDTSVEETSIIYQAMGEALIDMDLYDSAIDVIQEAIFICGEEIDFLWILLQSYFSLGDRDNIQKYSHKVQKLAPLDPETWYRLGVMNIEIEEYENAIDSLQYAFSLGYDPKKTLLMLISAYEQNENFSKVLEKAKEYLELWPNSHHILILAAKAAREIENWHEAMTLITKAIELTPEKNFLYLFQSSIYLEEGEILKAIKTLEKGIDKTKDPDGELQKELKRIMKKT